MKKNTNVKVSAVVAGVLMFLVSTSALAQGTLNGAVNADLKVNAAGAGLKANAAVDVSVRLEKGKERAGEEIDRRIQALTDLKVHIDGSKHVSETVKVSIAATVSSEILSLTALKTKIEADTDIEVLKTDIKSITQSYRIFALVIPQGQILATVDRISATADFMVMLGTKLQAKIDEAETAGIDVTAWESALLDFNAKLVQAKADAAAAVTLSAGLTPDMGDQAKMQSNKKALMDARAKIKASTDALKAARKDAETIVKAFKSAKIETNASAEASGSVSQ